MDLHFEKMRASLRNWMDFQLDLQFILFFMGW